MNNKEIKIKIKDLANNFDDIQSKINSLLMELKENNLKASWMDLDDIREYVNKVSEYLNYLEDDFETETSITESKKKRKKNYTLVKNAGNVEYNVAMFNHMNNSDKESNFFPGVESSVNTGNTSNTSTVESLKKDKKEFKDVYVYEGPVTRFGKPFVALDKTYINANSPGEALNRASYVIKKKYGLDPKHSKVELNPEYIKFVRSNIGKKAKQDLEDKYNKSNKPEDIGYIDDPSFNDEESGREIESYNKWLDENFNDVINKYNNEKELNESLGTYAYNLFLKTK